jgi:hypothetical protein
VISVSDLFKSYAKDDGRTFDIKAEINGIVYDNSSIVEVDGEANLMPGDDLTLGEIAIQKFIIKIRIPEANVIPTNAKVTIFMRMYGTSDWSEWIQLTPCYIDSRTYNNGVWTLTCYDRLMWTNQKFVSALIYPARQCDVLNEILGILGITLDPSVDLNATFMVPYKDEDATIHSVLSYIAASFGRSVKLTNMEKFAFV